MEGSAAADRAAASGAGPGAAAAGGTASGDTMAADWAFPVFVGCRRRLPPTDSLFEPGNFEREQLARQAAVAVARDERRQLAREAALAGSAELAERLQASYECGRCHASLPTARLLEIHVAEMHDSYFAAQAARRMPVYLCLVEGCPRRFCTVEERKQHLADHHKFPRHFNFDRLHLRRRKAQIRPLPRFQKGHGRQAMQAAGADDSSPGAAVAAAAATSSSATAAAAVVDGGVLLEGAAGPRAEGRPQQGQAPEGGSTCLLGGTTVHHHDDVLHGLSRLSMAPETSGVPSVIHFGHGRGRGLIAGRGRARAAPSKPPAPPPLAAAASSPSPADAAQATGAAPAAAAAGRQ